jgi:divalent metal cation (Fe/Co/Zn/Cd) transporter
VHHRIDSLTSIVALLTIGGAHFFTNASWLDPVGGLIIAGMVIKAGWGNTMTALFELADVTVEKEIRDKVWKVATRALVGNPEKHLAGVEHGSEVVIRDIQGIKSGQNYLIDLELRVPGSFNIEQTAHIEDAIRTRLGLKIRGVRRVRVKFVSLEDSDSTLGGDFISPSVSPRSSPEPEDENDDHQDHAHLNGNGSIKHSGYSKKDK